MQKIIDAHHHIWDLGRFTLDWLAGDELLSRSFSLQDYMDAISDGGSEYDVVKSVYLEVEVAPEQRADEARDIISVARHPATIIRAASLAGDLSADTFPEQFDQFAHDPVVKGVRLGLHMPHRPPGLCLEPPFARNVSWLGERGLLFEACVRTEELGDLIELAQRTPETTMVLNHMGIPNPLVISEAHPSSDQRRYTERWKADITELAALPNVVVKVSGLHPSEPFVHEQLDATVLHVLEEFDADKVMFGTNWPVILHGLSPDHWIRYLLTLTSDRGTAYQQQLFHDNAAQTYGIQ